MCVHQYILVAHDARRRMTNTKVNLIALFRSFLIDLLCAQPYLICNSAPLISRTCPEHISICSKHTVLNEQVVCMDWAWPKIVRGKAVWAPKSSFALFFSLYSWLQQTATAATTHRVSEQQQQTESERERDCTERQRPTQRYCGCCCCCCCCSVIQ
jgi:hypothetical protein